MICVQDDTFITDPAAFRDLILQNKDKYDLIWGPGGDQFFYVKKKVLQQVGWFDERYLGCYCGDADWLKRIWQQYDRNKLSIAESHDWGFTHNSIGVERIIPTDIGSKCIDPGYVNQHQEIEKVVGSKRNRILEHSQAFYVSKWGHMLNGTGPISRTDLPFGSRITEIDWYPWFTEKYLKGESTMPMGEGSFLKRQRSFWETLQRPGVFRIRIPSWDGTTSTRTFPNMKLCSFGIFLLLVMKWCWNMDVVLLATLSDGISDSNGLMESISHLNVSRRLRLTWPMHDYQSPICG